MIPEKLKNFSKRAVIDLVLRSRRVARLMSRKWLLISIFHTLLFVLASLMSISHAMRLMQLNSFSLPLRNSFLSNGSYILAQHVILSVNKLSGFEHSIFTQKIRNPVAIGSIHFLSATPKLSYPQHPVLIQNVPRHSTVPSLTATLTSLLILLSLWIFQLGIYLIWTRRAAREVVERIVAAGNISTHEGNVQSTSIAVPILSSLPLSRQSVQMGQSSNLVSCSLAHCSPPNGLITILILCMDSFPILTFYADRLTSASQHLQMAGLMTLLVQSGLRNHSFPRPQHETHPGSLFFSFSMVTALMKHHESFNLLNFITLSFSVFCLIPPTNCSLLTLVYLVHCNRHGWSDAIALLNSPV